MQHTHQDGAHVCRQLPVHHHTGGSQADAPWYERRCGGRGPGGVGVGPKRVPAGMSLPRPVHQGQPTVYCYEALFEQLGG
jgi:hypothetical protein